MTKYYRASSFARNCNFLFFVGIFSLVFFSFTSLHTSAATVISRSNTNVVPNGLVGYWTFDGKNMTNAIATDVSGNGNNGTLINNPTRAIGKIGQGLTFRGSGDYISIPHNVNLNAYPISFGGWFKTTLNSGLRAGFISKYTGASANGWETGIISKKVYAFYYGASSNVGIATSISGFNDDKWHHSMNVVDVSGMKVYVDGILIATSSWSAAPSVTTSVSVGRIAEADLNSDFPGSLDDMRVYNRAISAQEVLALYKAGQVATNVSPTVNAPIAGTGINSGLIGYWTFDGKNMTNTTATDVSGNGNNGTLTNMTAASSATIGKIGQALNFDGIDDFISVAHNTVYNTGGTLSIALWEKLKNTNSQGSLLMKSVTSGIFNGFGLSQSGSDCINGPVGKKLSFSLLENYPTIGRCMYTTNDVIDGKWHHVVVTSDLVGATTKIYIDGVSVPVTTGYTAGVYPNTNSTAVIKIGANNDAGWFLNGKIDDVRIYNRALSSNEVQALYKTGGVTVKPFTCGTSNVTDADGNVYNTLLIGAQCWMKQNLRVGTRIAASTAQSNNGTIEKYCYSDTDANCTSNDPNQPDGGLYQWNEAMQYSTTAGAKGICPTGWHIPTHDQLTTMERAICTSGSCTTDFPYDTSTTGYRGTNEGTKLQPGGSSGMEVNLAGYAFSGSFVSRGTFGVLWSSSESGGSAWYRDVDSGSAQVLRNANVKSTGFSVRCLKD